MKLNLKTAAGKILSVMKDAFQAALFAAAIVVTAILELVRRALPLARSAFSTPVRGMFAALALIVLALFAAPASWKDALSRWFEATQMDRRPLNEASSWFYHLAGLDLEKVARSSAGLAVIDYGFGGDARNTGKAVPLSKEQVARAKTKPDGTPRLAVAYLSIGEAENYRHYWQDSWTEGAMPAWHVAENCAWPKNHLVRFWHEGWKDIIYRGADSYLARIVAQGFDGVYLDRIDVFWELLAERPGAREDMIAFVTELAATARALKPGFLVIAQNAEDLLTEKRYRDVIDGLGKEDLLYGQEGTGVRNGASDIAASLAHIRTLQNDGKPVFAVEYLPTAELIASARAELTALGLVPAFAHRSLDGGDPLAERPPSGIKYGTAEWIKERCQHKRHW